MTDLQHSRKVSNELFKCNGKLKIANLTIEDLHQLEQKVYEWMIEKRRSVGLTPEAELAIL